MTYDDIPGPRSGDGPGDRGDDPGGWEDEWDNLSGEEMMDHLEDDALMDAIAAGTRGDLDADNLAQLLGRIRDKVDETDIPVPNLGKTERGENVVPPKRGDSMSSPFQELAARFAALTSMVPIETMHAAESAVAELGEAGNNIIGSDIAVNWTAQIEQVRAQLASASDAVANLTNVISETAGRIAQGPGNL